MKQKKQGLYEITTKTILVIVYLTFFLLILTGCKSSDETNDSGQPVESNTETEQTEEIHDEMLASLGIDVNSVEARTDPLGNSLPDDYNPLGKKIGSFNPAKELFFVEKTSLRMRENVAWDNLFDKDAPWTEYTNSSSKVANCDIDGDGIEELVVVYELRTLDRIKLIVVDDKNSAFAETSAQVISDIKNTANAVTQIESLVAANLDDDQAEELILNSEGTIYLFDDKDHNFALLGYKQFPANIEDDHIVSLDLSVGNIDGDPQDEFVVVQNTFNSVTLERSVAYFVFDTKLSNILKTENNISVVVNGVTTPMDQARIALGDIDGDGLDELVFYGLDYATTTTGLHYLIYLDDAIHGFASLGDNATSAASNLPDDDFADFIIATLDIDGDRVNEILVSFSDLSIFVFDDLKNASIGTKIINIDLNSIYPNHLEIVVGNFNADRYDDIVVRYNSGLNLAIYNYDENTPATPQKIVNESFETPISNIGLTNVDDDSIVLEYRNEHELLFTDPTVVAVISAPPFHASLGANQSESTTVFGHGTSEGYAETNEVGFHVGASIGVSVEAPLCGSTCFSMEEQWKIEAAFDWSTTYSYVKEEKYYYTTVNTDKVVFTSIPFDVYYYNVISAGSDATESVGEIVTINVPRKPLTTAADRDYYNAHNGDTPDITDALVDHTVGNVGSYMSRTDKEAILLEHSCDNPDFGCLYSSTTQIVGIGSGSTSIDISESAVDSSGFTFNGDISYEAEVGVSGITAGVSAGFHYGYNMTTEIGEESYISGSVGNISTSAFEENSSLTYNWGILAYPTKLNVGHDVMLVNYWVENYNP